jgi:hypothetical protein
MKVIKIGTKDLIKPSLLLDQKIVQSSYNGRHAVKKKHIDFNYVLSVVFAGGPDRTLSVITLAKVWGYTQHGEHARRVDIVKIPLCHELADIQAMISCIKKYLKKYPDIKILLNTNGVGMALGQTLRSLGIFFKEVRWGGECFSKNNKKHYVNRRTQAYVCLARATMQERFKVLNNRHKKKVIEQLSMLPYAFDSMGRFKSLSKEEMRRQGLPFPDISDALASLFLEGTNLSKSN